MLSGQMPFSGDTPMAVILKHISEPVPVLSQLKPSLPVALNGVIQRAMAKNPADRYATAGEMARALTNALGFQEEVVSTTTGFLKDAANRTIEELAVARAQYGATKIEPMGTGRPPRAPTGQTPPPTVGVVAPRPPTGSQTAISPAARGAAIGAGVVLLLIVLIAIIAGVAISIVTGNNNATSTAQAQIAFLNTLTVQAQIAQVSTAGAGSTLPAVRATGWA